MQGWIDWGTGSMALPDVRGTLPARGCPCASCPVLYAAGSVIGCFAFWSESGSTVSAGKRLGNSHPETALKLQCPLFACMCLLLLQETGMWGKQLCQLPSVESLATSLLLAALWAVAVGTSTARLLPPGPSPFH